MSAEVEVFAGICTANVDEDDLSLPKSNTQMAKPSLCLYINAPRAVIAPVHEGEEKSTYVVLPELVAEVLTVAVTCWPPAE